VIAPEWAEVRAALRCRLASHGIAGYAAQHDGVPRPLSDGLA